MATAKYISQRGRGILVRGAAHMSAWRQAPARRPSLREPC